MMVQRLMRWALLSRVRQPGTPTLPPLEIVTLRLRFTREITRTLRF